MNDIKIKKNIKVIKRNGNIVSYNKNKVKTAIEKAFFAVEGIQDCNKSSRLKRIIYNFFQEKHGFLTKKKNPIHIEDIQDQIELYLMQKGEYKVVRAYVLYREKRRIIRKKHFKENDYKLEVILDKNKENSLEFYRLKNICYKACTELKDLNYKAILKETKRNLFNGASNKEIRKAFIMATRTLIETEPNYTYIAARLLLDELQTETFKFLKIKEKNYQEIQKLYPKIFILFIHKGIELERLSMDLLKFDLKKLGYSLKYKNDLQFTYLSLQILYDRYFIHENNIRYELPQIFFMRVAMGLSIKEDNPTDRAIEFYNLLSSFNYMTSTPTLFNSGTLRPQLSSCYLSTISDDLFNIFSSMRDNALLQKFSGGIGNDWSYIRGMNSSIKGTNGKSQGIVPFLKISNDIALAVNQGGKRKGAVCAYLEIWHIDIEEFLELRKNSGDDRLRTHDMNTANWIPDLFMKRVLEDKYWTLFSPNEVQELHDLYGIAFEKAYIKYENMAKNLNIILFKKIKAIKLWRKMLAMLFETGHPWLTFKDSCNLRSPQQHCGVIHSSNLCTEITLNTSYEEIAVCNLGSINLVKHITHNGDIDLLKLKKTIYTAVRMLDNVIDINYYPVPQAKNSNLKHRPIGLGIMGFQDVLYMKGIPYESQYAIEFSDISMEIISYFAISASSDLALERGTYQTFKGSLWNKGILPIDSIKNLEKNRGKFYTKINKNQTLDWNLVRKKIKKNGMRNSNIMAIAPTATISNIVGVSQSIEPTYKNLFVKSNLSGEFTSLNPYLIQDLKKHKIWDTNMVNDLKYFNGSIQEIKRIPSNLKRIYLTAFQIDQSWLIECASRRQKWIDQAQSLNLYLSTPSGKILDKLYKLAWIKGLKTTYYLRSLSASNTEKFTIQKDNSLNSVESSNNPKACSVQDFDCETCQ